MSTAVAPGMARAHGFRGAGKGNQRPDSEELERNHNGFYADEEEVGREELRELEEALSDASSIGAASSDSSSIGEDSSSEKEEEEDVESEAKAPVDEVLAMGLGTLESLEDALPSKRASRISTPASPNPSRAWPRLQPRRRPRRSLPENPFNKRRRVLAAWSRRRASCSSLVTTYLPPLLPDHTVVEGDENEEEEEEEDRSEEDDGDDEGNGSGKGRREKAPASPRFPPPRRTLHSASQKASVMSRNMNLPNTSSFRSPRSFSLSDLQNAGYN
ncbi:hypothetical protein ZWY2020_048488 [Hordeum vulgare]|nr:hypothetical protein ZWY2020_048488 [Hordeum vulgare]